MRRWRWVVGLVLLVSACGGGDSGGGDDGLITVNSGDGVVSVEIPPGAAPDGFRGTVAHSDPSALGVDTSDLESVLLVYELGPDGTEFDEPVTVTFRISPALGDFDPSLGLPLSLVVIGDGAGGFEPLGSMRSFLDGDVLVLEGTTSHFSTAVVELLGGSIRLHPQGGFKQFLVDQQFEVVVLEPHGGPITIDGIHIIDPFDDIVVHFTVGRIDWSSEDPIEIVRIDPERNQAVMNCTATGKDITIRAEVYGGSDYLNPPGLAWVLAQLLTGGSAEFLGSLSLEIECVGGITSGSGTTTSMQSAAPASLQAVVPTSVVSVVDDRTVEIEIEFPEGAQAVAEGLHRFEVTVHVFAEGLRVTGNVISTDGETLVNGRSVLDGEPTEDGKGTTTVTKSAQVVWEWSDGNHFLMTVTTEDVTVPDNPPQVAVVVQETPDTEVFTFSP